MSTEHDPAITNEKLVAVLSNAVAYVANEAVFLGQYERIRQGRFTELWPAAGDSAHFEKRII